MVAEDSGGTNTGRLANSSSIAALFDKIFPFCEATPRGHLPVRLQFSVRMASATLPGEPASVLANPSRPRGDALCRLGQPFGSNALANAKNPAANNGVQ
jgi:hypothetical protein